MSVLNFLSEFFCSQLQSKQAKQQAYVCGSLCFIQLICLEKKSHVYLVKVFLPHTPNSFFSVTVLHSLH